MTNNLVVFNPTARAVETINAKTGANTIRILRAKEFKDDFKVRNPDASNKAIKAEYAAYYRNAIGGASTELLGNKLVKGEFGIEAIRISKDGVRYTATLVDKTKLETVQRDELAEKLMALDPDALRAMIASIQKAMEANEVQ